jgi:hypothetical protein
VVESPYDLNTVPLDRRGSVTSYYDLATEVGKKADKIKDVLVEEERAIPLRRSASGEQGKKETLERKSPTPGHGDSQREKPIQRHGSQISNGSQSEREIDMYLII